MANPHRGEVELKLGNDTFTLKLSMGAIVEAEERAKIGLVGISGRLMRNEYGFRELIPVIYAGFMGAKEAGIDQKCPSYEELAAMVMKHGLNPFHAPALKLLHYAVAGLGLEDAEKKPEPKASEVPPSS